MTHSLDRRGSRAVDWPGDAARSTTMGTREVATVVPANDGECVLACSEAELNSGESFKVAVGQANLASVQVVELRCGLAEHNPGGPLG